LEVFGQSPDWLDALLAVVEQHPDRRWTDADLRAMNYQPSRIRRWFKQNHGMTFQTYIRTRRLAAAMGQIRQGENSTRVALANGFDSLSGFSEAFKNWYGLSPGNSKTSGDPIWVDRLLTPLGPMIAAAVDEGLCLLEFADRRMLETQFKRLHRIYGRPLAPGKHRIIAQAADELTDYFAGRRSRFDVPLALEGTDFQMAVWRRLLEIPFGSTTSYESLANLIMRPGAQRAVGRANGDNRLAIIVPCHRVVRSDGSLCGYGGGIWRKQWLLDHEKSGE
jgi:AraC family transcriptional regulator of adaptative response/methylated-DNA-[protein]-cysteine methyltransferase